MKQQSKFEASENSEGKTKKPSHPDAPYPPCINPSCKSYGHPHPNCKCYGASFAEGGEVDDEYYCDDSRMHRKNCEYYNEGGSVKGVHGSAFNYPVDKADAGESEMGHQVKQGNYDKAKQMSKDKLNENKKMPNPKIQHFAGTDDPADSVVLSNDDMDPNKEPTLKADAQFPPGLQQPEIKGEPVEGSTEQNIPTNQDMAPQTPQDGSTVDQEESAAEQAAPAAPMQNSTPVQTFQSHKQNDSQQIGQEYQSYVNDVNNGHITPETYHDLFAKKDTMGKIGTLFGLMVAGAGAGLTHQPNAVLEMMNKEIDRDLQAQQSSSQNKQNFLKINQQNMMNVANAKNITAEANTKAYALSKMQMNYAALHKLVQDTQKLPVGSPQRQQAEQTLAIMDKGVQNENFGIADRAATASALGKTLFNQGGINTTFLKSGLAGPEAAEVGSDIESKTIPGVGLAKIPVPQHVRDQVQAMKILSDKAADLMNYSKANFATLSPAKKAVAKQKAEEMVNFYNSSIQGGVLTEGRLGWLDDQIKKNPTGVVTQLMGNQQRLNEIKNSNDNRMNIMLQQYGVPTQGKPTSPAPSSGGGTMVSKSGRQMVQKNGKWHYK